VHLELTPKGQQIASEILPLAVDALDIHLQDFTPAEVATLNALLGRMLANGSRSHESDE
jgi:DNA-binding MarR family transcriptional regulator